MKGLFAWLKNSSKMKRWILLILIGVVFVSYGVAKIVTSKDAITFGYATQIIVFFVLGFTCVILGSIFLNKRTMELFIEATDERMSNKNKVNLKSLIFNNSI